MAWNEQGRPKLGSCSALKPCWSCRCSRVVATAPGPAPGIVLETLVPFWLVEGMCSPDPARARVALVAALHGYEGNSAAPAPGLWSVRVARRWVAVACLGASYLIVLPFASGPRPAITLSHQTSWWVLLVALAILFLAGVHLAGLALLTLDVLHLGSVGVVERASAVEALLVAGFAIAAFLMLLWCDRDWRRSAAAKPHL